MEFFIISGLGIAMILSSFYINDEEEKNNFNVKKERKQEIVKEKEN